MSQTADRYAKALFELSKEQNTLEEVQENLTGLRKLIIDLKDFRQFLSNPLLSYEERCGILKATFEGRVADLLFKFLLFITYKSRLNILKSIIESFDRLYLINTDQLRAYVTSAYPLDDNDRSHFTQHLSDQFQHEMITRWTTDTTLIGGFRIFIQGRVYDYSFKNQLDHYLRQTTKPD